MPDGHGSASQSTSETKAEMKLPGSTAAQRRVVMVRCGLVNFNKRNESADLSRAADKVGTPSRKRQTNNNI